MSRIRNRSKEIFHLENNLYICGFQSVYDDLDKTREYYQFEKLKNNPKFKEIWIEFNTGFKSSSNIIPIELIDRFDGFEEDISEYGEGWYLGIVAQSQFVREHPDASCKRYIGPDLDWIKDAAIWWEKNESNSSCLTWLIELYVQQIMCNIPQFNYRVCKVSTHEPNISVIDYLLFSEDLGVEYTFKFLEKCDILTLFYVLYMRKLEMPLLDMDKRIERYKKYCNQNSKEFEHEMESYNNNLELIKILRMESKP